MGPESGGAGPAGFVELALSPPLPSPQCVVEVLRPDGARMTIRMSGSGDLLAFTQTFWSGRA
jgi:hypothetical protein